MRQGTPTRTGIFAYCSAGPTAYRSSQGGALTPVPVSNPASVWYTGGATVASMDNADTQYRALTVHAPPSTGSPAASPARDSSVSSTRPRYGHSTRCRRYH